MTIEEQYKLDTVEYDRVYTKIEQKALKTLDEMLKNNSMTSEDTATVISNVIATIISKSLESVDNSSKLKLDTLMANASIDKTKTENQLLPMTLQSQNIQEALKSLNSTIGDYAIGGLIIPTEMITKSLSMVDQLSSATITTVENTTES